MTSNLDFERLVRPWKLYPQKVYIFTNASLIDPVTGVVHQGTRVTLSQGLIEKVDLNVTSTNGESDIADDAIVVDLQGKYICPGLFDCHVHLTAVPGDKEWRDTRDLDTTVSALRQSYVCQAMLHRGFTSVRDCGGATLALKQAVKDGLIHGPRLFIAGKFLSQTGGHGDFRGVHDTQDQCCGGSSNHFQGIICDGVPQCLRGARENLRTGSDFLKIMGGGGVCSPTDHISHIQFTAEEVRAITTIASNNNTFVTSHAYTPRSIQQAVNNGVLGIEHGNLLDRETAELMAAKGAYLTPTLVTYAAMADPKHAGYMPPESASKNLEVLETGLSALKMAADAGVNICFGSDLLGHLGAAQSEEFSIRSKVLPPLAILQSATITPAKMLGQSAFLGQVKPGFSADILILNANPLEDITVLARPQDHLLSVIKEGRVYMSRWGKLPQDVNRQPELLA